MSKNLVDKKINLEGKRDEETYTFLLKIISKKKHEQCDMAIPVSVDSFS